MSPCEGGLGPSGVHTGTDSRIHATRHAPPAPAVSTEDFEAELAGDDERADGQTRFGIVSVAKALTTDLVATSVDLGRLR